jgi:hypothetical protein
MLLTLIQILAVLWVAALIVLFAAAVSSQARDYILRLFKRS